MSMTSNEDNGTRLPEVSLTALDANSGGGKPAVTNAMSLIKDMPLELRVVLGSATLTCEALLAMKQGEVLALDRQISQPVDLLVGDELVARGRLVAAGDQYGVQVDEVFFSA